MEQKNVIMMFIFMMILSILSISCLSAEDELYFQANTDIDLKIPCIYDNTVCGATFNCNVTITSPDGDIFVSGQTMTRQSSYYNYTLPSSDVEGKYYLTMYCSDGTENGYSTFFFNINKRGSDKEYSMISILIGFLILIAFFLVMGYVEEFWAMQWVSYSLAFIQLIFVAGVMYINNMGGIITTLLKVNFYVMGILGFGLLMIKMFFHSVMIAVSDPTEKKGKWDTEKGESKWDND